MGVKVRVLSVVPIETPDLVYDIEVAGNHNFVANGVVVHNCHRVGADYFSQSCFRLPASLRLGLSATPDRKDGREEVIYGHIGEVRVKSTAAPMVPRIISRPSPWKCPMIRDGAKMIQLPHSGGKCGHVISMIANHHSRNDMMANFITAAYKKGRTVLFQSDRTEHLETIEMMIQKIGVPPSQIGYYVGGMKEKDLEKTKGKRVMLSTYQMTAEGTDIPWIDTLVMGTPKSDVVQIVGRILREHPGKMEPLVFDLVDGTSSVFKGYWKNRKEWYEEIGAVIGTLNKA
jgi:superfamily II DNA or RNA helicase